MGTLHQRPHHKALRVAIAISHVVLIGLKPRQRHTHKVHEVVTCKRHRQGKGAQQHHELQYRQLHGTQQRHQHRKHCHAATDNQPCLLTDYLIYLGSHQCTSLQSFDKQEPDDGRHRQSAEDANLQRRGEPAAHFARLVRCPSVYTKGKGEDNACYPLYDGSEHECDGYRQEDAEDDRDGFLRIEQITQCEQDTVLCHSATRYLYQGDGKGTAEQFKNQTDGGGGRHAQRVEHIEQHHVCHHHRQEDTHHVIEREVGRCHDAVPRHVHHAIAQRRSSKNTDCRHRHHRPVPRHLGTDGRVQEVYCIIAHPDHEVEHSKYDKEYYNSEK